ncbi:MAG: DUF2267 domain-containing protein [Rhodothermales bacterium]
MSSTGHRGFDRTIQETNTWLHEIADELGDPRPGIAYHALRGVLFALRYRLTIEEVFDLSSQLPMLIHGIYFEGYRTSGKPLKMHREAFLERVHEELAPVGRVNPETVTRAVLRVLDRHIAAGEVQDVRESLPKDLRSLWPEPATP